MSTVLIYLYSVALALLLAAVVAVAQPGVAQTPAPRFSVIDSVVLHDPARDLDIPIKIYLPATHDPAPLIIFSHGFGSSKDGYVYLAAGWAQAGYAVILPTHHGGDRAALQAKGWQAVSTGAAVSPAQLANNASDVSFIITSLDAIAHLVPQVAGRIDASRIGVAGHSMGAGTTLVLAGETLPGSKAKLSDTRVNAFIAMSPQGMYSPADAHRWDDITRPTLTMYGSNDVGAQAQPANWRHDPYEHMPAGDKYNLVVDGANHFSFADASDSALIARAVERGQTRDINQIHEYVVQTSLIFWNAYLLRDSNAKSELTKHDLKVSNASIGTLESK